jgi:hypothetical protein
LSAHCALDLHCAFSARRRAFCVARCHPRDARVINTPHGAHAREEHDAHRTPNATRIARCFQLRATQHAIAISRALLAHAHAHTSTARIVSEFS